MGNQPEPVGGAYFDPDFPVPHRDLEHAKALLKQAGNLHPRCTMQAPNNPISTQVAEVIQAMSAEAGFDMKVQPMEAVSLFAAADRGDFQVSFPIWSGQPDPDQNISIWLASNGFFNRGLYNNAKLDTLLGQAAATIDRDQRVSLYLHAAAIYLKDRPYLSSVPLQVAMGRE